MWVTVCLLIPCACLRLSNLNVGSECAKHVGRSSCQYQYICAHSHSLLREVEGAWVLSPPNNRAPEAVVHFLGGAFVGAAPQLSYRLFLEALSNRNVLVG